MRAIVCTVLPRPWGRWGGSGWVGGRVRGRCGWAGGLHAPRNHHAHTLPAHTDPHHRHPPAISSARMPLTRLLTSETMNFRPPSW